VTVAGSAPAEDNPTASFTTAPNKVVAPQKIVCDGSNSDAVAGRTLTEWIWRFGDGTSPQSKNSDEEVEHRYVTEEASETFTITLIVIDDEDGSDTEQRDVVVENKQPVAGFEIYDVAVAGAPAGGSWVADDVVFPDDGGGADIQTDSATIWIRSKAPTDHEGTLPVPNDGTEDDPDPINAEPGNYEDHNLCYDPEGQDWDGAVGEIPFGWPNAAWGIQWYKVNWGDGNIVPYAYDDTDGLEESHMYTNLDDGVNTFTIKVTAADYLGGETTYSREITINTDY